MEQLSRRPACTFSARPCASHVSAVLLQRNGQLRIFAWQVIALREREAAESACGGTFVRVIDRRMDGWMDGWMD